MAFPQIVSEASSTVPSAATSHPHTMPGSLVNGNLLVALMAWDAAIGPYTLPTGWAEVVTASISSRVVTVYRRIVDGNEASQRTWTTTITGASACKVYQLSGQLAAGTYIEGATTAGASSATPDPPSLTPTGGAKDYLWFVPVAFNGDCTVTAAPSGYINMAQVNSGSSTSQAHLAYATRELNAASHDPGTYTLDISSAWCVVTVAVHPAAAVVGGVPSKRTLLGVG